MKHRIKIKRRDGIKQRYWVGRKLKRNYGSKIFREQIKNIDLTSTDRDRKQFQRFMEKHPELKSKIDKSKIRIENMGWLAKYEPETDTIFLPSDIFGSGEIPQDIKKDIISLRSHKHKMLLHELTHKKQEEEGRLPKKMDYITQEGRIDWSRHHTNPFELEAKEASKKLPERKLKPSEEQIAKSFREAIK